MTNSEKARNWVFTLNNPTEEDEARIAKPYDQIKYVAYSHEVGESGTPHFQGFLCAWEPIRMTFLKKYLPRAHLEIMHGRLQDNEAYCSKQGELIEIGEKPEQGRRTDLISVKRRLEGGTRTMDLAEEDNFFVHVAKHSRFFEKYEQHLRGKMKQKDREMPKVYIRLGPGGTGKTRWLDEQFGLDGWVYAPDNRGQWFDGCDRDVILFDDVEAGQIPPLSLWKRLTDRYPFQVAVKGGFIVWKPKVVVFTSNHHPFTWWPDLTEFDKQAIERRITSILVVE